MRAFENHLMFYKRGIVRTNKQSTSV